MNKQLKGNLSLLVARSLSGLNMNALKYLIPLWMAPLTGVTLRVTFATCAFWLIDSFRRKKPNHDITNMDKLKLLLLGAVGITTFMTCYLSGLKYTTPVASSIILALIPIWVFVISLFSHSERLTWLKGIGLAVGLGGALLSFSSKEDASMATNPMLGNILTLISSIDYAFYLIFSNILLKRIDNLVVLKWSFLGAVFTSVIINLFTGWYAPVLELPLHRTPLLILLFILIFPTTISYLLIPIGLKTLSTTVVSMYGYLEIAIAATVGLFAGQDKFE